jgi:thiamine-phosphate pyrophosphorylase
MFVFKNKYFLIIESIKDINLSNIKRRNKFVIIYRNYKVLDNINDLQMFRNKCKIKSIEFYVANNIKLSVLLKVDGLYLSSNNNTFKTLFLKKFNYKIIGSAHNRKEISNKIKQGCDYILLSKLFTVNYDKSAPILGVIKFNEFCRKFSKKLVPLGGIKISNLNSLKNVKCESFAILSEIKKKPAKILSRLF